MSKSILISFIGTGSFSANHSNGIKEYRKAKYSIDGKQYESSFVSSVICRHLNIKTQVIIGTVRSMWEELYHYYCVNKGIEINEDYYLKLAEITGLSNHETDINSIDLKLIENTIGDGSKCIIIPYGLNEQEQLEIFRRISMAEY